VSDNPITKCPNGHASMGDGQCNVGSCAHCDPIVHKSTKNKDGIPMGTLGQHGFKRWGR
jgi:hypothetical protein